MTKPQNHFNAADVHTWMPAGLNPDLIDHVNTGLEPKRLVFLLCAEEEGWRHVRMQDLRKGDVFSLYEPDGELVGKFIADQDADEKGVMSSPY